MSFEWLYICRGINISYPGISRLHNIQYMESEERKEELMRKKVKVFGNLLTH